MSNLIDWIKKPSMNKLIVVIGVLFTILFVLAWRDASEVSALPLAWLLSISLCTLFYLIDRIGFAKIDTIEFLKQHEVIYAIYMVIYAGLVAFGHYLALSVFNH